MRVRSHVSVKKGFPSHARSGVQWLTLATLRHDYEARACSGRAQENAEQRRQKPKAMASVALLKLPPDEEDHARAKAGYQLLLLLLRMAALLARTLSWFSSFVPWQWHCPHQRHTHTLQAVGWHQMEPRRSLLGFSVLRFGSKKLLVQMIIGCPPLERGGSVPCE